MKLGTVRKEGPCIDKPLTLRIISRIACGGGLSGCESRRLSSPEKRTSPLGGFGRGSVSVYIYIYAFSRRFYPKRLTVHSGYTFIVSMCVFPGNRTHNLCAANTML